QSVTRTPRILASLAPFLLRQPSPHTASFKGSLALPATTTFRPHRLADWQYGSPGHPRDDIGCGSIEGDGRRQDSDQTANQDQALAGFAAVEEADEEQDLGELQRQEDSQHGGVGPQAPEQQ